MGHHRRPPAGSHVPAVGRAVPAGPVAARPAHRDPRAQLRGGGLREPVSLAGHWREHRDLRGGVIRGGGIRGRRIGIGGAGPGRPARRAPGKRPVRGDLLQPGSCRLLRRPDCGPGGHRPGRLDRPKPRSRRAARGRAGLLFREPRPGDRGHAESSARADLPLPVRHPPHDAHAGDERLLPAGHGPEPVRRRARGRAVGRVAGGGGGRALDRVRAACRALALRGPSLPPPPSPGPAGPERGRAGRVLRRVPRPAAQVRPALRHASALHLGLAPGSGPAGQAGVLPAPGARHDPPRGGKAEVPGRLRVRHGRVHQRHRAGDGGVCTAGENVRLLVTGGAGYIGSVVAAMLADGGHDVVVLDDLSTGHADAVPAGASFRPGTVREDARPVLAAGIDAVLHFAAKSLVAESVAHPARYWEQNLGGTLALLEAMRVTGTRRIVFSSTAAVYGEPEHIPITEADPVRPTSPYGASKVAVDTALAEYARMHQIGAVSLRYFNVAGAHADAAGSWRGERHSPETHLIPAVLAVARDGGGPLPLVGGGYPTPARAPVKGPVHGRGPAPPPPP